MKKIIYNIAIVLAASCLFASCEDDNYDEPNSGIKGRFIDAETSEVVPMPVQGTSSIQIRMYERDRSGYHVSQDRWDLRELVDVQ